MPVFLQNKMNVWDRGKGGVGDFYWHFFVHVFPQGSEVGWNSILAVTAAAAVMLMMASLLRAVARSWLDGQRPYTGTGVYVRPAPILSCHVCKFNWNQLCACLLWGRYERHRLMMTSSVLVEDEDPLEDWSHSTRCMLVLSCLPCVCIISPLASNVMKWRFGFCAPNSFRFI